MKIVSTLSITKSIRYTINYKESENLVSQLYVHPLQSKVSSLTPTLIMNTAMVMSPAVRFDIKHQKNKLTFNFQESGR